MFQPDWCSWHRRCLLMFLSSNWCSCGLQVPLLGCAGSHAQATPAEVPSVSVSGTLSLEHSCPLYLTTLANLSLSLTCPWQTLYSISITVRILRVWKCSSHHIYSMFLPIHLLCDICHINYTCHIITSPLLVILEGTFSHYLKHFGGSFWRPNVFQNGVQKLSCLLPSSDVLLLMLKNI